MRRARVFPATPNLASFDELVAWGRASYRVPDGGRVGGVVAELVGHRSRAEVVRLVRRDLDAHSVAARWFAAKLVRDLTWDYAKLTPELRRRCLTWLSARLAMERAPRVLMVLLVGIIAHGGDAKLLEVAYLASHSDARVRTTLAENIIPTGLRLQPEVADAMLILLADADADVVDALLSRLADRYCPKRFLTDAIVQSVRGLANSNQPKRVRLRAKAVLARVTRRH
jgi:hypothetical protein